MSTGYQAYAECPLTGCSVLSYWSEGSGDLWVVTDPRSSADSNPETKTWCEMVSGFTFPTVFAAEAFLRGLGALTKDDTLEWVAY